MHFQNSTAETASVNSNNFKGKKQKSNIIAGDCNQPVLITLQQLQLGNFAVVVWGLHDAVKGQSETREVNVIGDKSSVSPNKFVKQGSDRPNLTLGDNLTGSFDCYEVRITPDPHFGLGLRLDVAGGAVVVESFKRNPLTMKPMPAEEAGIITIGDELLSVNSNDLKGNSLADVIQIIRVVVQSARGAPVTLKLRGGAGRSRGRQISTDEE